MTGPIFISHASSDADDVNRLALALRAAFHGELRTFNTSSGTAIAAGLNWRERILEALEGSAVVILWATRESMSSTEVAFEIGAAYAFEKRVLPCCVHISPGSLKWSLSERQALIMDQKSGWERLAKDVADAINYASTYDLSDLDALASDFTTPLRALEVESLGLTLVLRNVADVALSGIAIEAVKGCPVPDWAASVTDLTLEARGSMYLARRPGEEASSLVVRWTDLAGTSRSQSLEIPAVAVK